MSCFAVNMGQTTHGTDLASNFGKNQNSFFVFGYLPTPADDVHESRLFVQLIPDLRPDLTVGGYGTQFINSESGPKLEVPNYSYQCLTFYGITPWASTRSTNQMTQRGLPLVVASITILELALYSNEISVRFLDGREARDHRLCCNMSSSVLVQHELLSVRDRVQSPAAESFSPPESTSNLVDHKESGQHEFQGRVWDFNVQGIIIDHLLVIHANDSQSYDTGLATCLAILRANS
ncbi:hypothetical protein VNO77_14806 [Canavalia gladiata]|uniref:Uncharacterized protein n=1 Tax=Canavalia gladiata TaxID=3824 RepID=A0AAN9LZP8_CANGL